MIVTECTACTDERDAGAAFCEVCGRALSPETTEGEPDKAAESGDRVSVTATEPGDRASAAATEPGDPVSVTATEPGDRVSVATGEPGDRASMTATEPDDSASAAAAEPGEPVEGLDGGDTLDPEGAAGAPVRQGCPHCAAERSVAGDGYCEECGMLAGRPRDHIEADGGAVAAAVSDRGRRHHRNEDAMWLAVGDRAADVVVSDGVSASFDPDAASDIAARTAGELLAAAVAGPDTEAGEGAPGVPGQRSPERPAGDLRERTGPAVAIAGVVAAAIAGAAEAVVSLAHTGDPRRAASNPACTIVAAAVRGPHVGFGWVGDSRAYWLGAQGPARQLTEDDSWVTHVVALGADPLEASNDPRAHAITAWLGADAGPIKPRVGAFTAAVSGLLVLCSDGLWNYLPDPQDFADVVRECLAEATGSAPLLEAARGLVTFANAAGGGDNITVALVPVHAAEVDTAVDDEAHTA